MHKILVLGSNSFTGSCFVDYLLKNTSAQIFGVSRSVEKEDLFLPYKTSRELSRFSFHQMDFNHDTDAIIDLVKREKISTIANFAAQSEVAPSWENPDHWYQTNVLSTHQLFFKLRQCSFIQHIVHTSSPEVYGTCFGNITEDAPLNPSTPYAASKAGGDLALMPLIKNFNLPMVMMRATNIYGKHQQLFKIIPRTIINILLGRKIELHGGGVAIKSYLHSYDICHGTYLAMTKGRPGEIYHLSPQEGGISVRDLVKTICRLMNTSFEECVVDVAERPGQDAAYIIDSSKAQKELGWKNVVSRQAGLEENIEWVRSHLETIKNLPLSYQHKA